MTDVNTDDARTIQAKVLWDAGFGKELWYKTFEEYLATIPEIPEWPDDYTRTT